MSDRSGPLRRLRAIEFGQLIAGPYTGTLLADFGADLIKVEPATGDPMREWGRLRHRGHSLWWSTLARNKRSVVINLREAAGQEVALALCRTADIVLENFRPGTMERWGLGPEQVHAVNDRCVYVRVSGYGQTGRYRDRAGFASSGEAVAGLRKINGYPDQAPPRTGLSLGDALAAQSAFQGALLALYARDVLGERGQVVDASIVDACFAITESMVLEYQTTGEIRQPSGPRLPKITPSNVYRTLDERWVVIAANHDTLWRRLAETMGRPELGEDERFATHGARGEHEDELDELIGAWAATLTAAQLEGILERAGVVCAPVNDARDIAEDPYFRERELLVDLHDEVHGDISAIGVIPKLSGTPGGIHQPARWTVWADTREVLGELGYGEDRLGELERAGVISLTEL
jgi:crotonobetainyl-CoA:carnitine CoA-transferase CaiB-like acyl-CoA transferase